MKVPFTSSSLLFCLLTLLVSFARPVDLRAQQASAQQSSTSKPDSATDKATAYYNYSMGHLYAELAGAYGNRGEYLNRAIDFFKAALKADPTNDYLVEELTDLYLQSNQLRTAVGEAEDMLKKNPDNVQARRMLARIYTRLIGDAQQGQVNEEMLKKATEQYQIITSKESDDVDSWVTLGRLYRVARNSVEAEKAFKKALEHDPENEDAMTGLAMVYSDVGDTTNMVAMLQKVADKSPNLRTLTTLASAYEQMRDYAGAAEVLKRALALSEENAQLKRALAENLLRADEDLEALALYQDLAKAEPRDIQIQLRIAEIYRSQRAFDKAAEALAKARELDRDSLEVQYEQVNLLEAQGKMPEAIDALKKMVAGTTKSQYSQSERGTRAMLLERLGYLYRNNQQYPEAAEAFKNLADFAPESGSRAAVHLIDTYRISKDYKQAESAAAAAIKKYPDDRLLIVSYANLLSDLGRTDEAAAKIRSLIKGDDRDLYLTLAQIYEKAKKYPEMAKAIDQAEKASKSDAEMETVHFMRGAMHEKMKDFDAAEKEFRKILEANPDSAGALNYLGYMLADRNIRLNEARDLIQKAVDIEPNNGAFLDSLGWVHYRLGNFDKAENFLVKSIEHLSGDPTVHDHLGDVYMDQGKVKQAIDQWQLALREWEKNSAADRDEEAVAKVTKKLEGARTRMARENSPNANRQ